MRENKGQTIATAAPSTFLIWRMRLKGETLVKSAGLQFKSPTS
jgi:hypothetical protein